MNNKKRGSNCAGSALVIGMIVMAVLVVGSGVGLGAKTGLDTRKWNNLSQAVDSYRISYFSNQKENLGKRWEDTGIFDFSERKDILEQMEKLEGSAKEADTWFAEETARIQTASEQKEDYHLSDGYADYESYLESCMEALESRDYEKARELTEEADSQLEELIEENETYIEEKVRSYAALDLSTADVEDKTNLQTELQTAEQLAKEGKYNELGPVFEKMDEIAYRYMEPEHKLNISVQQVDASAFPNVRLYLRVEDACQVDGDVRITGVDWRFCRAYVLEYQDVLCGNFGSFTGRKMSIPEFLAQLPRRPVVAAFTATATPRVREDILSLLELRDPWVTVTSFDRPNLYFEVRRPKDKLAELLTLLAERRERSGIVYCGTRKAVEEVCEALRQHGYAATRYHGGLEDQERLRNQEDFLYDRATVMVATNAFGMGIDKSNVSFVIHYTMPKDLESYYQEAGRAGRDGSPAQCFLLYSGADVALNRFLFTHSDEGQYIEEEALEQLNQQNEARLQAMIGYCHTTSCLREYILHYFGEHAPTQCGNCQNCLGIFQQVDVTQQARGSRSWLSSLWASRNRAKLTSWPLYSRIQLEGAPSRPARPASW